jgi:hypothetical protein
MRKKILVLSILAAVILVLASLSSVVGSDEVKSSSKICSPLFTIRRQKIQQKEENKVSTNFLGKGKVLQLFIENSLSYNRVFYKAINMLERNPALFNKIIERLESHPLVKDALKKYDITEAQFNSYANNLKNNPSILSEEIKKVEKYIPSRDSPVPLGLNDTNPFAFLILLLVLLPVLLMITTVIATATIITCLNLGGCFEALFENIVVGFFQGLT